MLLRVDRLASAPRILHGHHRVILSLPQRCQRQAGAVATRSESAPLPLPPLTSTKPDEQQLKDYVHPVDIEQFRKMGYQMIDEICDYHQNLETVRVKPSVQPGYLRPLLPASAPDQPESFADVMADMKSTLMPGVVHWQSPKFFAYFSANSSFPSMLAEMWMSTLNMIGFSWAGSPVSTELEMVMMDWLAELSGLPNKFMFKSGGLGGGVIQGTSSEAVLVALLAARARTMRGRPPADALKLVAYSSDQAHSCFLKAGMVAGTPHMRCLPAIAGDGFALQPAALEAAMAADVAAGLIPFYYMAIIGTTSSCAVDPVKALTAVAHRHGAWVHVDAAFAGAAALLPEQRHHFAGVEDVDSYSFNPHKWLLTNFDCCCMWVDDSGPLKEALSLTPVFLQGKGNALDFKDWQVPLGRRFRSLKLYFVMRMYGAEKLREYVRHHIALANYFADRVVSDARFELAAQPQFALVCFRLRDVPRAVNLALLEAINGQGDLFLIHTELAGQYTIRMAIGSTGTQLSHVQYAWETITRHAAQVLLTHDATGAAALPGHSNGVSVAK